MKRTLTVTLALLTMLSLAAVAHADLISSTPGVIVTSLAAELLPWILTGTVVGITIFLLKKFWKKKK